jgi:hypothetical protein
MAIRGRDGMRAKNKPMGYKSSGNGPEGSARFHEKVTSISPPKVDVIAMAGKNKKVSPGR